MAEAALYGRRCHHGAHDLVVAGAAAEVARQPEPDLLLGRICFLVQQRLRGDDEPGRADAALQRRALEKCLLERVQSQAGLAGADALDGRYLAILCLDSEHEA